ncbi:flavodoxin FldA [Serratia nematodiphila DZ0503SBS1]|nr:flavodoxin FldA [Serratia nematodiphila DZ0503SBS1]
MATVGIFFGSDTGNTENIAKMIQKILQKQFGDDVSEVHDIAKSSKEDLEGFDILLLGIPTWYYGEAQCDWDDFFPTLEEVDFNGKLVALFGCGDQEDYAEYFCDAMGTIRDIIEPRGAAIVGHWPTKGYHFEASKGLADDNHFIGLAIDEDRQPELTNERVDAWVKQIVEELSLADIVAKRRDWRKVEQRPCKVHSVPTGPSSATGIAAIEATDL